MSGAGLIRADAVALPLADESVDLIVTSPPYFALRSYTDGGEHYDGQIGSEPTPQAFLEALWAVTAECRRVLKPSGSLWVNLGDKYGDRKSLMGLPWRYAIGCIDQLDLILRAEVVWSKPNGLPESVTDRVRRSHEQWFHFTKEPRYFAAVDEVREPLDPRWSQRRHTPHPLKAKGNKDRNDGWSGLTRDEPTTEGNPIGKLPGSVWEGLDYDAWEHMMLSGPPAFCPRCGRDLAAGGGAATPIRLDTAEPQGQTDPSSTSTGSPTSCSSDPSPTASPSTTSAATADAATPPTSKPSPDERTSSEAGSPCKPTASTDTASTTPTSTGEATGASAASVASATSSECVCEMLALQPSGPRSVWTVPSEPLRVPEWLGVDHFAAFPQELVRRIILGWSPSGICVECGEGRRPVVEKEYADSAKTRGTAKYGDGGGDGFTTSTGWSAMPSKDLTATITGYACACPTPDAPTRPAVVLDPFGGTGTVAMVARALGRYGVHIDLSADYLRLANWRVFQSGHAAKTAERTFRERQGDLFGGAA